MHSQFLQNLLWLQLSYCTQGRQAKERAESRMILVMLLSISIFTTKCPISNICLPCNQEAYGQWHKYHFIVISLIDKIPLPYDLYKVKMNGRLMNPINKSLIAYIFIIIINHLTMKCQTYPQLQI